MVADRQHGPHAAPRPHARGQAVGRIAVGAAGPGDEHEHRRLEQPAVGGRLHAPGDADGPDRVRVPGRGGRIEVERVVQQPVADALELQPPQLPEAVHPASVARFRARNGGTADETLIMQLQWTAWHHDVSELTEAELAVWRGFLRLHAALAKQLDAELDAAHGLPLTSYEVLINLQAAPGQRLRMAELADRALLSRSGMTRLVDRLERQGLLERDTCASDAPRLLRRADRRGARSCSPRRARRTSTACARSSSRHLEPEDFERLQQLWETMLPGSTSSTHKT